METKTKIILGLLGGITLTGGVIALTPDSDPKITLDLGNQISWAKPTTDKDWAEDVKAESFHIKSTGVLEGMRATHADKLERYIEGSAEELTCEECIKFKIRKQFPEYTVEEVNTEWLNRKNYAIYEIEKLTQSVERMDNELRLRKSGFVVVEGEGEPLLGSLLGAFKEPYAIREIRD